jgi:pimeloyl-ACP methyl ester carboxylesterase
VATPEYRRVGGSGGWPTTAFDVEAAYGALPDLLVGLGLTWDRTVTIGHSAGGHLVLWLASRQLANPPEVTVALAAVCDLTLARGFALGGGAVDAFLGDVPITEADPMTLLTQAPPGDVFLIHGVQDRTVPVELSRSFTAAHPWAELVELPGAGHFEFLDPTTPAFRSVESKLRAR